MRSKILVYLPPQFFIHPNNKHPYKKIKELGFDQIVVDSEYVVSEKSIKQLLSDENISLFAVCQNINQEEQKIIKLMEVLHTLDTAYVMVDENFDEEVYGKFKESGLKFLYKSKLKYFKNKTDDLLSTFIIENPLSFVANPLQSTAIQENPIEVKELNDFKEKPVFFLIKPNVNLDLPNYLMQCKDILNRFYFLGIR